MSVEMNQDFIITLLLMCDKWEQFKKQHRSHTGYQVSDEAYKDMLKLKELYLSSQKDK